VTALTAYASLFLSALIAATILPAQSELVLVTLLLTEKFSTLGLLAAASAGSVLGSVINYGLGRLSDRFITKRWFPTKADTLARARKWYSRFGRYSLLLSWVPIIGDPITVAAGVLREPFWSFLLLVTIAKVGRYLVLAALTLEWM